MTQLAAAVVADLTATEIADDRLAETRSAEDFAAAAVRNNKIVVTYCGLQRSLAADPHTSFGTSFLTVTARLVEMFVLVTQNC
jgi:hypothetical protein